MTNDELFELLSAIPGPYRMLCIDAAAVGCYLIIQGKEAAGRKLISTAISTAGLENHIADELINNLPDSLQALAMHAEIKPLF